MKKIFLVDKPAGWTSFDVVAKLRSHFSKDAGKKVKVGHAGTLDPFATGLLVVLVGEATKEQDIYMKKDKEYTATLKFGFVSTTGDPEGEIEKVSNDDFQVSELDVKKTLEGFIGEIEQVPPKYSAIKIAGKKAYELVRAGKAVELKPRKVRIYELEMLDFNWPLLKIRTKVSSGTYIRTLAEDVGKSLGTGAYLTELRRTKIGDFDVTDAQTVDGVISSS